LLVDYGAFQLFEMPSVAPAFAASGRLEVRDDFDRIHLNAVDLDTAALRAQGKAAQAAGFQGKRLHLVQFIGPILPEWYRDLLNTGVRILAAVPQNAFLVYGDAESLTRLSTHASTSPVISWHGQYLPEYKVHPHARPHDALSAPRQIGTDLFAIQLVLDEGSNPRTLDLVRALSREPLEREQRVLRYLNVIARVSPDQLDQIAQQPDVLSVQPWFPRQLLCERQAQISAGNITGTSPSGPGYLGWLASKGFTQDQFDASGFVVDISDSGIDNGTAFPNHFGLYSLGNSSSSSRVAYNRLEGTPHSGSTIKGCDGHGNLNAHVIGGYDDGAAFPFLDPSGYHYGLGICPFVKVGSSVVFDPSSFTQPNYNDLQSRAYQDGARISNNSWGGAGNGIYDQDCQNFDALVRDAQPSGSIFANPGNQEMVIVFSAGNSGPNSTSISSPGTGKNVLTVGASESVQSIGGTDGSGISDAQANSVNDLPSFTSRGPCGDGRHKPDLVVPGTHVSGGVAQSPSPAAFGTADPCFNGNGVSGGVGSKFFPSGQQFYTASSGTSHAAPAASGACALVRQYFINNFGGPPSPAMTKAYLLNSTRYLIGTNGKDTLWSNTQGMGCMNLGMAFDGVPRVVRDQSPNDLFTSSGQVRTFSGVVLQTNQPFRVTLAWTDAPGSTAGAAYNNNLDLVVSVGGKTYRGNVFSGAFSATGGSADFQNNVESVFLAAGTQGRFVITVTASDINSDGVPQNGINLDQDFALVVYNAELDRKPAITAGAAILQSEMNPTNNAIDPGETLTMSFGLQNVGNGGTSNLMATLLSSGGVTSLSPAQLYGAIPPAGQASRSFNLVASGACGDVVTASLRLQDDTNDLGTVTFALQLGKWVSTSAFAQNFDDVTPPQLPADWSTSAGGSHTGWITSATRSDSSPNAAFASEPDQPGTSELLSPEIMVASPSQILLFKNHYDIEADPSDVDLAYDGGVLEISVAGGPFQDILAAGGSFLTGGYSRIIDATSDNPLAGRSAWSGNSAGFIRSQVQLPPAAQNQLVRFKWVLGTDTGNFWGGSGWNIDSIELVSGQYQCATPMVAPTITNFQVLNGTVSLSFMTVPNQTYMVEYSSSPSGSTWTPLQPVTGDGTLKTVTDTLSGGERFYRVRSP
jgi:hypothetical protein